MEKFLEEVTFSRDVQTEALHLCKRGEMHTWLNENDTTAATVASLEANINELTAVLSKYGDHLSI